MKIAIIYTTFLRPELAKQTIASIKKHWVEGYHLLIADQNRTPSQYLDLPQNTEIYNLPFDCGLSYARNFLVKKAWEINCNYSLLTADSIQFTDKYNFTDIIDFMELNKNTGIVGLEIKKRVYGTYDMELLTNCFLLDMPCRPITNYKNIAFQPCDLVRNFFLAKTETLLDIRWDDNLKLAEHEDFFYRFIQKYKVYFTESIEANYIKNKQGEYGNYRFRLGTFQQQCCRKYNIDHIWTYTPALKQRFREYQENGK